MQFAGSIVDVNGNPLAGVSVQAYDPKTSLPYGQPTHTGAQGSWEMDLPAANYILYFYLNNFLSYAVPAGDAQQVIMKPGLGYQPQPGELLPVSVAPGKAKWAMWALLLVAGYIVLK